MNQSELEANLRNRRQVRENACEQVATGLSFTSVRENGVRFFSQSQSEVVENESKTQINFDTQLKTTQIHCTLVVFYLVNKVGGVCPHHSAARAFLIVVLVVVYGTVTVT